MKGLSRRERELLIIASRPCPGPSELHDLSEEEAAGYASLLEQGRVEEVLCVLHTDCYFSDWITPQGRAALRLWDALAEKGLVAA